MFDTGDQYCETDRLTNIRMNLYAPRASHEVVNGRLLPKQ